MAKPSAPRSRAPLRWAAFLVTAWSVACSDATGPVVFDAPIDLVRAWESATPGSAGMDEVALARADSMADAIPRLRSLLVVRRGRLVHERYWGGRTASDLADVRSVTKSIVSTLTGFALDRGYLTSLDQTLGELLPASVGTLADWERAITVRDLLTMSGGWDWHEAGAIGYNDWILSDDPIGYLLATPEGSPPGLAFAYNSAAVNLLGVVLEQATGKTLPAFADEVLFGPLHIGAREWEPLGTGVNGGAGLDLRPRDLARIGQLFLQDGWSGNRRILPEGWVAEATTRRWGWLDDVGPTDLSYGYLWWTDERNHAFMAWGFGGQYVYVAPERDLVVVATTEWGLVDGEGTPAGLATEVLRVIVDGVLPAAPPH